MEWGQGAWGWRVWGAGFLLAQWDPWFLPQGVAVRTPGGAVGAWRTDTETLGTASLCPELQQQRYADAWATCQSPLPRPAGSVDALLGSGCRRGGPRGLGSRVWGTGVKSPPALLPPQRSERPSKSLTATAMASSPSRSWARPCARWATCPMRSSWKSSSSGWTWTVSAARTPSHPPAVSSPFTGGWGWGWGTNHRGLALPTSSHPQVPGRLQPECERRSHT